MDTAYNLYRMYWRSLVGVVALLVVPLHFVESYLARNYYRHGSLFGGTRRLGQHQFGHFFLIIEITTLIGLLVVRPLLSGAFTRAVAGFHLGEQPTGGQVFDYGLTYLASVLLVVVLVTAAVLGGLLLLIVPGIIFSVRFTVAPSVVVVEGLRGTRAVSRAWALTRGNFWRLLGILLVVGLVTAFVAFLLALPFGLAASHMDTAGWVIRAVGTSIAALVVRPFGLIVQVLLYLDLRVRSDGLTLDRLQAELQGRWPRFES